ncbi:MAG: hypothetical protein IJ837_02735 [Clostridia bacterium]|nr:hypothetical protein [Clostridia bacterium]
MTQKDLKKSKKVKVLTDEFENQGIFYGDVGEVFVYDKKRAFVMFFNPIFQKYDIGICIPLQKLCIVFG